MNNAERYKKQIETKGGKFGFSDGITKCNYEQCPTCIFSNVNNPNDGLHNACTIRKVKWLLDEYNAKPKVTEFEYKFLKYLADNTNYMYICRDKSGKLFLYEQEPYKDKEDEWWVGRGVADLSAFSKLFRFIHWENEKPTAIREVAKNCRVFDLEGVIVHKVGERDYKVVEDE